MTTIRQLITDGFREAGILEVGVEPDAEEHEEGLRQIERLIRSLFGNEFGEKLQAINYGTSGLTNPYATAEDMSSDIQSVYVPANCRIIFNNSSAQSLDLHPNPQDGARLAVIDRAGNFATYNVTLRGNGRNIEEADSVSLSTNDMNREWFFRQDLGNWVRVTNLEADDESPFPIEFDDLLTSLLAFRLNPRYGAETDTNLGETLREMRSRFRSRYRQTSEQQAEDGLIFLTNYPQYFKFDFNKG